LLANFSLRAASSAAIPAMLDEGVRRMDDIFSGALASGRLRPDASLIIETPVLPEDLEGEATETGAVEVDSSAEIEAPATSASAEVTSFTVEFETPDVASVSSIESSVKGIPGIKSASTNSLALGGVSVMRVSFAGDEATLKLALTARGFRVQDGGGALRISRGQ
jgi:hypothetical protein